MKAVAIQSDNAPPTRMSHSVQKPQKNPHLQLAPSGSPGPEATRRLWGMGSVQVRGKVVRDRGVEVD